MKSPSLTLPLLAVLITPACKKDPAPAPVPAATVDAQPAPVDAPPAPADAQPAAADAQPAVDAQPAADSQPAAADAQPAAADAQPAADTQPNPAGDGTRPADTIAVEAMPTFYAPLFKDDAQVFAWSYEVDTHDAEAKDPVAKVTATVTCRSAVTTMAEARLAKVTCEVSEKQGSLDVTPALDGAWIATADGLWRHGDLPDDPAGLAEILKSKPFLPASPVAMEEKRPGDPDKDIAPSSTQVVKDGEGGLWCRTDDTEGMYGTIGNTWCFTPDKGVTRVDMGGRSGPSMESYTRK